MDATTLTSPIPEGACRSSAAASTRWLAALALAWGGAGVSAQQLGGAAAGEAPELVVQLGHGASITAVAFSSDGQLAATGSGDQTVLLWAVETGAELRRMEGHTSNVSAVAFSPDGRHLATSSLDGSVRIWDVETGAELLRLDGHHDDVQSVVYAPDGRYVLSGGEDGTARLWDAHTGEEVRRFEGHEDWVIAVGFSPDGRQVLTGSLDDTARLWDANTGEELRRFEGHEAGVTSVAFSPDGEHVLTGGYDDVARLWDARTGVELRRFSSCPAAREVAFSPDGRLIAASGWSSSPPPDVQGLCIWDAEAGAERRRLEGFFGAIAFSPDGRHLLAGGDDRIARLWDVEAGTAVRRFEEHYDDVKRAALSGDGRHLLTGAAHAARLWDLETGSEMGAFGTELSWGTHVAFSPDGRRVIVGTDGRTVSLLDVETGAELQRFEAAPLDMLNVDIGYATFSPDGRHALLADVFGAALWDTDSGQTLHRFPAFSFSAAFSPDGRRVLTANPNTLNAHLWDAETGAELQRFTGHTGWIRSVAFSSDGRHVLTGSQDGTARRWDAETGAELHRFEGHASWVFELAFSPDGRRVATGSADHTVHLWDVDTGAELWRAPDALGWLNSIAFTPDGRHLVIVSERGTTDFRDARDGRLLASLVSFTDGTWAVVAPDGRFDTNDLEAVEGLHWVAPDDPLTPLPIEAFMADLYEPRLLPRLLAGEAFPEAHGLLERNRVQPAVAITDVALAVDGTASVTVTVEGLERAYGGATHASGAHDLRLFRDGQLVAWRDGEVLAGAGTATLTLDGLALPSSADTLTFSAYAFNADRVKSRTAYAGLAVPEGAVPARERRAYVVSLGVDAFADPAWDLRFAANDARQFQAALPSRLAESGQFDAVVAVPLLAAHGPPEAGAADARKATLRAVLDLLAGRPVPDSLRARIPEADRLAKATPDDLVLLTASSHGYADGAGVFYVLPEDVPPQGGRTITPALLTAAISSDELSLWLQGVDAGPLALVVDACHAAAAVEGSGFKPGPMGSRGLGQLAFDKGMRVLTATQSDDVALESDALAQGLLSFALVRNGLEAGRADTAPEDGRIELGEWLRYGVERVPALYEEVRSGAVEAFGAGRSEVLGAPAEADGTQRPSLFDFTRGRGAQVVVGIAPGR